MRERKAVRVHRPQTGGESTVESGATSCVRVCIWCKCAQVTVVHSWRRPPTELAPQLHRVARRLAAATTRQAARVVAGPAPWRAWIKLARRAVQPPKVAWWVRAATIRTLGSRCFGSLQVPDIPQLCRDAIVGPISEARLDEQAEPIQREQSAADIPGEVAASTSVLEPQA